MVYCIFYCDVCYNSEDCSGKKEIVSDLSVYLRISWYYILASNLLGAVADPPMSVWIWDVVLPSWSEDCDKGESLIGPIFVVSVCGSVQEESWSWEILAVSIFVIFILSWCYLNTAYKNCSCGVNTYISVLHCRLGLGVQPAVATGRRRESKEWFERRHCDGQQGWNQSCFARTYSASVNRKHIPCCTWII